MLQNIRDRFTGVMALAIIGAIAVALAVTLVKTEQTGLSRTFAARVNGEEIPVADYRQIAQRQILQQQELTREELPAAERDQINRNVLESLVRNRVVAQYVNKAGYRVSDARVAAAIRETPVFQVAGKFSSDGYQAALASQGISPAAYEQERRAALEIEQLQNGLLESAFFTPAEFRRFVVLEGERRKADYAIFDAAALASQVTITGDEVQAYYEAHPDHFESRESVSLDYVEASPGDVAPAEEPTEAELRAAYESDLDRYRTTEQRRARHILVAVGKDGDEAAARKAADLRARLDKGEDFAALAKQFSDDPGSAAKGGELGWAGKGTYVQPFEDALFATDVGKLVGPVKTEFGYHIIQVEEVRPGAERPFNEVRAELAQELRTKASQDRFFELTEKMDDAALENPGSLDAVAKATGLPVRHVAGFTREGGEPFGANRAVIEAAFSSAVLVDGENSPLVDAGEGRALVLRVAEHRPAKLRPLDEVRAQVETQLRAEKAATLAAEKGQALLEKARAGGDFAALAAAAGARMNRPDQPLARNSAAVPAELLAAMFRAPRPAEGQASFGGVAINDGGYGVFRVDEILPGRPDDLPAEQRDARKAALARQSAVAEATALAVDLREAATVVIAPDLFEQADTP